MQFPYAEIEFEKSGRLHDPGQRDAALDLVRSSDATDVLVLVHGWNNDMVAARRLFEQLADSLDDVRSHVSAAATRRFVVLGALWPSVRWADEDDLAGGGAGVHDEAAALREAIGARVDDPAIAAELDALVPELDTSAAARQRFVELLRAHLPDPSDLPDDDEDPPPAVLLEGDPQSVFDQVAGPDDDLGVTAPAGSPGEEALGGAAVLTGGPWDEPAATDGGAAGFSFGGILRGARSLLNLTTYYTMKARAGHVGAEGVAPLLEAVADAAPDARLHLAGHSFGARVVAAAAATTDAPVHAVAFLQGAFSHHGLAADYDGEGGNGAFRPILAPSPRVTGPVLVTHTANDRAVGLAYAVASRLARQQAAGIGGPGDIYGGIGRNGALKTPEVAGSTDALLDVGADYRFAPGHVHNLRADRFIGSHSAVTGAEVGYALLAAMTAEA